MPENAGYMFAAYIASALVCGGYVLSLVVRARALSRRSDAIGTASRQ